MRDQEVYFGPLPSFPAPPRCLSSSVGPPSGPPTPPMALSHHKRQKCWEGVSIRGCPGPASCRWAFERSTNNGNTQRTSVHALGAVEGAGEIPAAPRERSQFLCLGASPATLLPEQPACEGASGKQWFVLRFPFFLSPPAHSYHHPPPPVSRPPTRPSCTRWPPPW